MPNHHCYEEEILCLTKLFCENTKFSEETYAKNEVKRGLRDERGRGVITGLTDISDVIGQKVVDGNLVPTPGELYYRGVEVKKLIANHDDERCCGYEEAVYLLFFNKLPNRKELDDFRELLAENTKLPKNFVKDVILKSPSEDIMNSIARSVLMLYSYDKKALDTSIENVLRQTIKLIAVTPLLAVYAYHAHLHYNQNKSLIIHKPNHKLSLAQNILHMLRSDCKYSELEARVLDVALILHAEHGGGNNSTFTTHVVTSTGSDTYSTITAALCSLKGPRHGGANIKVMEMMKDIKAHVTKWSDKELLKEYLSKMLSGQAFDNKGLIYGMGHAVYSMSDPRAEIFKKFVGVKVSVYRITSVGIFRDVIEIEDALLSLSAVRSDRKVKVDEAVASGLVADHAILGDADVLSDTLHATVEIL